MILHVHSSYVTLTFLSTMNPLGVSPLSLSFLPPSLPPPSLPPPHLLSSLPSILFFLLPLLTLSSSFPSLFHPFYPSSPTSTSPFTSSPTSYLPISLPSSLFPFASPLTVFSDFPEWQKVALSSPPPREAFVPPHLEPRVRVSTSCWQHCSVQPSIIGAPWAVTRDNTVPASLTA